MEDGIQLLPHKFNPTSLEGCEDLENYEPGGYHPVYLDDTYDQDRYKVVHKLGAGGFSTVWLARDVQQNAWVALKFIVASQSEKYDALSSAIHNDHDLAKSDMIVSPKRRFWVDGPNGRHLCLVLDVVGPNLSTLSEGIYARLKPAFAAHLSHQAAQAMELLHSHDRCHGDFRASNMALALSEEFQSYEIADIQRIFGPPDKTLVQPCHDPAASPGPHAPRYAVGPMKFLVASTEGMIVTPEIRILDFDQSFQCDTPPKEIGTPAQYMAPEVTTGESPSKASDVWSLGCTIFRLRCGMDLFYERDMGPPSPADTLEQIQRYLGDFPDNIAQTRFDEYGWPIRDKERGEPLLPEFFSSPMTLEDKIMETAFDSPPSLQMTSQFEVDTTEYKQEPLSLRKETERTTPFPPIYDQMVWKPTAVRVDGNHSIFYEREDHPFWGAFPRMEADELKLLVDLLSRIFVYDPAKRATLQEILQHPWFTRPGQTFEVKEAATEVTGAVADRLPSFTATMLGYIDIANRIFQQAGAYLMGGRRDGLQMRGSSESEASQVPVGD